MRNLTEKAKHYGSYLIFGILTTLVNISAYALFTKIAGVGITAATILAWTLSVLFAFVTNRLFVFHSIRKSVGGIIREMVLFFSSRLFTGALDVAIMNVFAIWLGFDDMLIKIMGNGIIIVLNYVLSKAIVFTRNEDTAESGDKDE